jgi:hypothetical protein
LRREQHEEEDVPDESGDDKKDRQHKAAEASVKLTKDMTSVKP